MTKIEITTIINAPTATVFNLNRNIDVHIQSTGHTNEKTIAGRTSGLIGLNETVTWRGKHFGFYLTHTSRITTMDFHEYFVDEMEKGHFKSFKHEHYFEEENGFTVMKDKLCYETPYGIFGWLFNRCFLQKYLYDFILTRNQILKKLSENQ